MIIHHFGYNLSMDGFKSMPCGKVMPYLYVEIDRYKYRGCQYSDFLIAEIYAPCNPQELQHLAAKK